MKRFGTILLLLLLSILCFTLDARALETEELFAQQAERFGSDQLEQAGESYLGDVELKASLDVESLVSRLAQQGRDSAQTVLKHALSSCLVLLTIVLLFGLVTGLSEGMGGNFSILPLAAALAITAVAVSDMFNLLGMGRESMENMQNFSKVLLPSVAAATAAAGAPGAAVAKQLATVLFSDCLITLINKLLLPLCFAYIAASVAYAAVGNEGLRRIGGFLKWMVHTMLGAFLLAFIAYLNISGAIAGSADAATVKAAKFTVSNLVPVVGGILSDAAETVLAGASMLRSAIGVFGMFVVLAMCLMPFLHLGAHYLAYKATSALAATVADSRTAGLIDAIGSAFGLVLAMTASCAMLLIISMVSAVAMVTG